MAKLRVQVMRGHRFEQVPLRMIDGGKLYVTKDEWTYVDTATDLALGEEYTIYRLREEGRLLVKTWSESEPDHEAETEVPESANDEPDLDTPLTAEPPSEPEAPAPSYPCPDCPKVYKTEGGLIRHQIAKHSDTGTPAE